MLITVDFEKMIEDDHEHCCGAEEEGEGVEGGVGDHFFVLFLSVFWVFGRGFGRRWWMWWFGLTWSGLVWWLWLWCVLGFNGKGRTIKLARA